MRILVTGSSGFIGTTFCEWFADTHELHGVDRVPPVGPVENVIYATADLRNANRVRSIVERIHPDVIVHLAAQARVEPSFVDPAGTYQDNVLATVNLIQAALAIGDRLRAFVYASSETVYGRADAYPTTEECETRPESPYAASKAASEQLVRAALEQKALILRSGMGFGPRSDPRAQVVARFLQRAFRDQPLLFPPDPVPGGHPTRDINYVTNFVEGVDLALASGASGTFNVASGVETSILELAHLVVRRVGCGKVVHTPSFEYRRGEAGMRTWLDITKARDAFGYRPRTSLEEGLRLTIEWCRANPNYFEGREPLRVVHP